MDIYAYFQHQRDSVASLAAHYSVVGCRSLIIVRRRAGQNPECLEILPQPMVEQINPRLIELNPNLRGFQFEVDDLRVQIPRTYYREDLTGQGVSFLLDGAIANGQPVGGIAYVALPGLEIKEEDLSWSVFLRRRKTQ